MVHAGRFRLLRLGAPLVVLFTLTLGGCDRGAETEILWDSYGVPHIFAVNNEELFFAYGSAQMESHADLILQLYGEARGRAAEYWGEDNLQSDVWVRTMEIPGRARAWYNAQDDEMRRYLDYFAQGMNAYADAHRERIDDEMEQVLPVEPWDVLAHTQRAIHFTFISSPERIPPSWRFDPLEGEGLPPGSGSNAWAIGPSRSASGNAMLLGNPHLLWSGLYTWYEAQLVSPDVNAYGATLVGIPSLVIGFNEHLGWTHTVNSYDGMDLYELTLRGDGYLLDGEAQDFRIRHDTLLVRGDNGDMREEVLPIRYSIFGPVVGERGDRALSMRVAGLETAHIFRQYWMMIGATNFDEFETALDLLQIPMFTTMYADRDGHIYHLFNGRVPVRPHGDDAYWGGIIPGDDSGNLWERVHPMAELPQILDPESGWLQNANDPPWYTTFPEAIDADDYPPYMAPRGMAFRPQRSARMLFEDESVTFEEMVAYKHSTRMEMADRLLDDLIPAARDVGSELARAAADVLEAWDRAAEVDSRGAVLFVAWVQELARVSRGVTRMFADGWSEESPRTSPDGLGDPEAAVAALEAAARQVEEEYGALDVPFGEVHRLVRDGVDLPANGYSDPLGVFRAAWYRPADDGRMEIVGGDSFVFALEFSTPVRAEAVMGYGNASQPGSPHRTDQLELFSRKQLRPVWRTRSEIEEHLSGRTRFRSRVPPG